MWRNPIKISSFLPTINPFETFRSLLLKRARSVIHFSNQIWRRHKKSIFRKTKLTSLKVHISATMVSTKLELFSMLLHGARISARISRCRETFIICMEMSANGPARQVAIFRGHFLGAQSKKPKRRPNRLFSENSSLGEQNFLLVSAATFKEGLNCGAMKALFPPRLVNFLRPETCVIFVIYGVLTARESGGKAPRWTPREEKKKYKHEKFVLKPGKRKGQQFRKRVYSPDCFPRWHFRSRR